MKEWLVKYKFKNWDKPRTAPAKSGQAVTSEEKDERATEIARDLGNNKLWHSHGRSIGIVPLTRILKLEIEDYSTNAVLKH